jgi:hypothetical protein
MRLLLHVILATATLHAGAGESDYYRQAMGILDPTNTRPHDGSRITNDSGRVVSLDGIEVGSSPERLISAWGRPFHLSGSNGRCSLRYNGVCVTVFNGVVHSFWESPEIRPHSTTNVCTSDPALAIEPAAFTTRLNELLSVSNRPPAMHVGVHAMAELRRGCFGGHELGACMQDAVAIWGRPTMFCRLSPARSVLWYGFGSLAFDGDVLRFIGLDPRKMSGASFDNGIAWSSDRAAHVRTLNAGTPDMIRRTWRALRRALSLASDHPSWTCEGHDLVSESDGIRIRLQFDGGDPTSRMVWVTVSTTNSGRPQTR